MRRGLFISLLVLLLWPIAAAAQTATPTPTATATGFWPTPTPTATQTPTPVPTIVASNLCQITGTVTLPDGSVAANTPVYFHTLGVQNASGFIIPGGSDISVFTNGVGALPSNVYLIKKSLVQVTVGSGQPVQIQVPTNSTADLGTLILANLDPPSVVSDIAISNSSDVSGTVVNPATGAIGTATITLGPVTGIQGVGICSTVPTTNQLLQYNGTAWCPATYSPGPLNPANFGCHNDLKQNAHITTVNGSTTLTSSDSIWSAADVGKVIRIENTGAGSFPTAVYNILNTTIAAYVSPTQITLGTTYPGTGESGDTAE